ncbi:hypothetical protein [Pelagibacterium lacus]|uniref:Autotransporter outer membrane beta-barrel domain-containing protein n=1 Tax=Pelagibacterium lacus TaxID=2282655 RepID=A0A369W8L1_9HYPH|nr:hypothetical protein [Pelagibacterium lacus]RDE10387.1 hypothetical protein DVH29_00030 [Pelagibacterium lacus]
MSRTVTALAAIALAAAGTAPVLAADWGTSQPPVFRPAYPVNMAPLEDSLDFEIGLRYVYGIGRQSATLSGSPLTGGGTYSSNDTSHIIELAGRIDDHSTSTYLKGAIGYAAYIDGSYDDPFGSGPIRGGRVASLGADFGYTPLRSSGFSAGGFIGYQYLNESPDTDRGVFLVPDSLNWSSGSPLYTIGRDNSPNLLEVHALRLGLTGRAELGPMFDISAEVAAIPYANLSGTLGAHSFAESYVGGVLVGKSSATSVEGHLYGGAAELMAGFNPTENLSVRFGARGYYLTGPVMANYSVTTIADAMDMDGDGTYETGPTSATQYYERQLTNFDMFRWGPVIELTGRF